MASILVDMVLVGALSLCLYSHVEMTAEVIGLSITTLNQFHHLD